MPPESSSVAIVCVGRTKSSSSAATSTCSLRRGFFDLPPQRDPSVVVRRGRFRPRALLIERVAASIVVVHIQPAGVDRLIATGAINPLYILRRRAVNHIITTTTTIPTIIVIIVIVLLTSYTLYASTRVHSTVVALLLLYRVTNIHRRRPRIAKAAAASN